MDWVFDENQKLTYDNPVFIEQCKRQKKNFDALNTGWVPQRRLDEIAEDEIAEDEDLEEPEEITAEDEANMFIDSEEDENEDDVINSLSDKAEDKPKEESKQPGVVADKPPDISMDDLDTLFSNLKDNEELEESEEFEDDEDSEDVEDSEDEDSEDDENSENDDVTDSESEVELKTSDEIKPENNLEPEASSNISLDFEDISEPVTVVSEEPKRLKIKIKSDQTPKIKLKANNTIKIKLKKPEE